MSAISALKKSLLTYFLCTGLAEAGAYMVAAPAQIDISTSAATTQPLVMDYRLGYQLASHQLELALMKSHQGDAVNQLQVDVPTIQALFYRYSAHPGDRLKSYLIIGASQVDIISSYPGSSEFTESYQGLSVGLGFEEAFKSIPQLKMKLDWIKLYKGRDLDINSLSLGLRYEF